MGVGVYCCIPNIAVGPQGSHPEQLPAAAGPHLRFISSNRVVDGDILNAGI